MGTIKDQEIVHDRSTNTWWFWDVTNTKYLGPFLSEEEAKIERRADAAEYLHQFM